MMFYISYDFVNDKMRNRFSKFLKKFWRRIQYSVFEIKNSPRFLALIKTEIEEVYAKQFANTDSVIIVPVSDADMSKIERYGYPAQEEKEILFL